MCTAERSLKPVVCVCAHDPNGGQACGPFKTEHPQHIIGTYFLFAVCSYVYIVWQYFMGREAKRERERMRWTGFGNYWHGMPSLRLSVGRTVDGVTFYIPIYIVLIKYIVFKYGQHFKNKYAQRMKNKNWINKTGTRSELFVAASVVCHRQSLQCKMVFFRKWQNVCVCA